MPTYAVISPEYDEVVPVLDYGEGPIERGADVVMVEARNKREAKILGLKELRKLPKGWINRHRDRQSNPFVGLTVEEVPEYDPYIQAWDIGYG